MVPEVRRKPAAGPNAETATQPVATAKEQAPVDEPAKEPRSGRGWRILRLAAAGVILGAILAAGIIFAPILYSRYIAPIGENTADVNELRSRVAELQAEVDAVNEAQAAAAARVDGLDERLGDQLAEHTRLLDALEAMDRSLASDGRAVQADLSREVSLLKAMELMSRARLFLYESNFGLAEQDLEAARELLAGLDAGRGSTTADAVAAAVERLDRTLEALPEFPVVASDDLDIAWQALLGNVPTPTTEPSPTPSPTPATTPSASPTEAP